MTALAWTRERSVGRRRWVRHVLLGIAIGVVAWASGFAWFVRHATIPTPTPPEADGIVVLTGGADRVRAGLLLLAEHRAGHLLVTGIGGHASFPELARQAGIDPAPLAPEVTLGRGATSTRGNADEIAAWARAKALHTLIVVTAFYHMPRALAEIRWALPGVALYPASVSPVGAEAGWAGLRLLAEEYTKYLATELGLSALAPASVPRLSAARPGEHAE